MAIIREAIRTVKDNGDVVLSNIIDSNTGESVEYIKVPNPVGITPDGVIYRQLDTAENGTEIFKRIYSGYADVRWFGAKGDGVTDDTNAIQLAFDQLGVTYNNLIFNKGRYIYSQALNLLNKSDIKIDLNGAELYDLGKDITLQNNNVVKTPVGWVIDNCNNIDISNLESNGVAMGGGSPIVVAQENNRVPYIDFQNCSNLNFRNNTLRGLVGPYLTTLSLGAAHFMRASYLRFINCSVVNITENTVASGCGNGEIFSFNNTDYITWENCYHTQGSSPVSIYSWGKVIDCDWVTVRGHKVQTASQGSFIDFLGENLIMSDIVFNGHINSKLLDVTAEWNLPDRAIKNVRLVNCFTSGRGITSAGGTVSIPDFENIYVDNVGFKQGSTSDATILMGFENIREITLNNLNIKNIRSIFTAEIAVPTRDFYHTYIFNNLVQTVDVVIAANVIIHEANGLTEFNNSKFYINTNTTNAVLDIRDRHCVYLQQDLTFSRSLVRYNKCDFYNTSINLACNVEFNECNFYNCVFTTNEVGINTYRYNPSIKFNSCSFEYIDSSSSISSTGRLIYLRSLNFISVYNCQFNGITVNTDGVPILTHLNAISGDITLDKNYINLRRNGGTGKNPGLYQISNNSVARNISITNNTFTDNSLYMYSIVGNNTALPTGVVVVNTFNNKFMNLSNTPVLNSATDVSRVSLTISGDYYMSGLDLGSITNFNQIIIKAEMIIPEASPEGLYNGSQGCIIRTYATNGYTYIKQSSSDKTGWIQQVPYKSGTTAQRPPSRPTSFYYYDTTLGKPIWWNGTNWIDATGTIV